MTRFRSVATILVISLAFAAIAKEPPKELEFRKHWALQLLDGRTLYEVTDVTRLTVTSSENYYLIRGADQREWLFTSVTDFKGQRALAEIRDLTNDRYVRSGFKIQSEARTRVEGLLELQQALANGDPRLENIDVTVETAAASKAASESDWKDPQRAATLRRELRASLPGDFLDALEEMRETLFAHDVDLGAFHGSLTRHITYGPDCERSADYVQKVELKADCAFDRALGMPCTKKQAERIERANKRGDLLHAY